MQPYGKSAGYVTYPLRRLLSANRRLSQYELIFIDGRSRCDCLTIASLLLRPTGVVVLHDAHRKNYLKGLDTFSSWLLLPDIDVAVAFHDQSALPHNWNGCGRVVRHGSAVSRQLARNPSAFRHFPCFNVNARRNSTMH